MPLPSQSSEPVPPVLAADSILQNVLARPDDQRRREHQYRFGQTVVFGLPVLALQWFGRSLGGEEAGRWVGLLQALLTGWVVYVASVGMLAEGVMRLSLSGLTTTKRSHRVWQDSLIACVAVGLYLWSVSRLAFAVVLSHQLVAPRLFFHWVVLTLGIWTGLRWFSLAKRMRAATGRTRVTNPTGFTAGRRAG